jgi:hypothetical protein
LHLVADDDDLMRAIDRRDGLLQRNLARLVEDTTSNRSGSSGRVSETLSGLMSQIGFKS